MDELWDRLMGKYVLKNCVCDCKWVCVFVIFGYSLMWYSVGNIFYWDNYIIF